MNQQENIESCAKGTLEDIKRTENASQYYTCHWKVAGCIYVSSTPQE